MVSFEKHMELEKELKEAGDILLSPPCSIDELLMLLDKVENLLIRVDQAPPRSMQKALLPLMKALISDALLRNSDMDVKVSVASCIIEITRITAPEAPYNDERMKEIFQLTVAAFENLSHVSSRCYIKAASILDTVARVRLCVMMLDLGCDDLIIEMFQLFLKKIRSNHPSTLFLAMESIMTMVLDESEDISWGLLSPLLASVRKGNQKILPISWKLGENVIANCAYKIKPYLMKAVQSRDIVLGEYSPIIASVCKSESATLNKSGEHLVIRDPVFRGELCQAVDAISKSLMRNVTGDNRNNNSILNVKHSKILELCSDVEVTRSADAIGAAAPENFVSLDPFRSETEPDTVSKKTGRRPNSLMTAEEGYNHSWNSMGRNTMQILRYKKPHENGVNCSLLEKPDLEDAALKLMDEKLTKSREPSCQNNENIGPSSASPNSALPGRCRLIKGRSKRKESLTSKRKESLTTGNADRNSSPAKKLKLKDQGVEKLAPSEVASLQMKSEAKPSETKQRKCSSRVPVDAKTTEGPLYFAPEKEARVQSDLEEKNSQHATLNQHISQRTWVDGVMLDKSITGAFDSLSTISRPVTTARRGGNHPEKTPKTNPRRQRNAGKEMASKLLALAEELVGRKIKVWWPMDKTYYNGVVDSYNPITKKHRVLYADGDEERLDLKRECWQLIDDKGQEANVPKPDISLYILPKQEGETHSSSPKLTKPHSFSKRTGAHASASTQKSKSSGDSFPDCGTLDEPMVHESVKDASMKDCRSSGDSKKLADELKVEGSSTESERTISETLPSSDNSSTKDGESPTAMPHAVQGSQEKETSV